MKTKSLPILLVCAFMLAFVTCKKEPDPNIQSFELTKEDLAIGTTSATIEGTYSYAGVIDGIKVCLTENGADKGEFDVELEGNDFSVTMTGLKPATEYQYNYAVDYGFSKPFNTETKTFTTTSEAPTVKILEVRASEDSTSFRIVCKVEDDGGSAVISRGICWSIKYDHPTMNDDTISDTNGGSGEYYIDLGPEVLSSSTKHYVRAFARNARGLGLSEPVDFRTPGETTKPEVTTVEVSEVTYNSAYCLCNVRSDGGLDLRKRGVCYGESATPGVTINIDAAEATLGEYGIRLTGLEPNKDYHVHAYATNDEGTSDGEDITFHTTDGRPTVTTLGITEITETTATAGGNVTDQGYSPVTERGICWNTHPEPEIGDYSYPNGSGEGSYTGYMTDLTPDQTYYVRAYATNSKGTAYGDEVDFMAMEGLPSVETVDVTNVTTSSAKVNYKANIEGGLEVDEHGVCWSESNTIPTINDHYVSGGNGTGTFSVDLTGLNPGTKYYVRAYAKNEQGGEAYGTAKDFTTEATLPTVTTDGIEGTTAHGTVTADGGKPVTERGICWGLNHNPTTVDMHGDNGTGLGGYTVELTDLQPGKTYYYRAYATNEMGTAYGLEGPPLVVEANPPTVNTGEVSNIQQTTAQGSGNVTDGGGAEVTERGACWSTSPNPTIANSHADDGVGGLGNFTVPMTGLTANTHYYVRAYAKNREGKIGYGSQTDFTTAQSISAPTVTTTSPVTNITQTTATGGGNVTNDGGSPVTERGICWSTSHNPIISGSHSSNGTGTGAYQVNMTGLTPGTTYYVRAYAKNDANLIGYGTEVQFTTQQQTTYTITVSANPSNGGTVSGGGTYNQGASCTVHAQAATNYQFTNWTEGGTVVSTQANYTFTVNSNRTLVANFITVPTVITTDPVTNIQQTTATGGGNVTNSGGATVTARGVCWSTSSNPTINNSHTTNGTGTGSFTSSITGLTAGTLYHVRAYATNSAGTAYGADVTFTTQQVPTYTISVYANPTNGGQVTGGGTYNYGTTVNLTANANSGFTFDHWQDGNTNNPRTITVTGNATYTAYFEAQPQVPTGAINGKFTINANGAKVYFSNGNLQYIGSSQTWKFADPQWEVIGTSQGNTSQATTRDLFGWGTSGYNHGAVCYQPWSTSQTNSDYYAYGDYQYNLYDQTGQADWGYNSISNGGGQEGQWRTLTKEEWVWVLGPNSNANPGTNCRTSSTVNGTPNARYAKAKVNNLQGVVLFPDSYTHPSGVAQPVGINETGNTGWNGNNYSTTDFGLMQDNGAVFLPAAGYRGGTSVSNVGSHGYYWSASYYFSGSAYIVGFGDSNLSPQSSSSRYVGHSVRLVCPAEN